MNLDFNLPTQVITGEGCVQKNAKIFSSLGKKALLVTGGSSAKRSGALDDVTAALESQGIGWIVYNKVRQNPLLSSCKEAGDLARENGVDFIIGIGGGSPLDEAKAVAVFAANEMEAEAIYRYDWKNPALPIVLVGTTAGTASEVTAVAVITVDRDGRKNSIACQQTYAAYAFGDPKYTYTLPLDFTLSTTLDALSHAVEAYYSSVANAVDDLFAIEAVRVLLEVQRQLTGVTDAGQISHAQRAQLYYGSLLAGFPLNHCGTCYCHRIGYFLSEDYHVPHGYACALTLPDFLRRGEKFYPQKAAALYRGANTSLEELVSILETLNKADYPKLTEAQFAEAAARWTDSIGSFQKSPGGFTGADAKELARSLLM